MHRRGVVDTEPGLYFVGQHFLYSLSSAMIHGVGRDAEHVAKHIAALPAHRPAGGGRVRRAGWPGSRPTWMDIASPSVTRSTSSSER